jgi:hypothetical protein
LLNGYAIHRPGYRFFGREGSKRFSNEKVFAHIRSGLLPHQPDAVLHAATSCAASAHAAYAARSAETAASVSPQKPAHVSSENVACRGQNSPAVFI